MYLTDQGTIVHGIPEEPMHKDTPNLRRSGILRLRILHRGVKIVSNFLSPVSVVVVIADNTRPFPSVSHISDDHAKALMTTC